MNEKKSGTGRVVDLDVCCIFAYAASIHSPFFMNLRNYSSPSMDGLKGDFAQSILS